MRKHILQERLRYDRLEAFYNTIHFGTEELAARKMNLDPGTVRKRNLKLEEAWKAPLLIRHGGFRRSTLTPLGERVFRIAKAEVASAQQQKRKLLQDMIEYERNRIAQKKLLEP